MTFQENLISLQDEIGRTFKLDQKDYRLDIREGEIEGRLLGLQLQSVFQPIYDIYSKRPLGYEALLRATDANQRAVAPPRAFHQAEIAGELIKFDRVCRTLHTLNFLNMAPIKGLLFLNVHPQLLVTVNSHGKVFEQVLHEHSVPTDQVVIEINEGAVEQEDLLSYAIANYRERGYKIALDDFGRHHSNLERLWRLSPDYVKFDGSLIQQAEKNTPLQKVLPKLIEIVRDLGGQTIVEGIETPKQEELAIRAGAHLLQGYHIGRPAPSQAIALERYCNIFL